MQPTAAAVAVPTPVERFGKDHWSVLAYAETCCVDGKKGLGTVIHARMRCNSNKRPLRGSGAAWRASYSTRLKGFFEYDMRGDTGMAVAAGFQLMDHDDWDCLDDLEAAGFVEVISMVNGVVRMTPLGYEVAAAVRKHKAEGKMFATFVWPAAPAAVAHSLEAAVEQSGCPV
jgi:hypothetical protein